MRRRPPARRPLNVPRHVFSKRGLAGFRALPPERRAEALRRVLGALLPARPSLGRAASAWPRAKAASASRPSLNGAEQVICATGFRRGYRHHPLLARLVDEHGAAAHGNWLVLDDAFAVPGLSDATRTLAVAGVAAQWAYPAADTLVGMKAAARAFLRRTEPSRTR